GADTLRHYRDWRRRRRKRTTFLARMLRGWELRDEGWDDLDEDRVRAQLAADRFQRLTGDDLVIAFAFAQLIVDGDIAPADRERALLAIKRQGLPCVMEARNWSEAQARRKALGKVRQALGAAAECP